MNRSWTSLLLAVLLAATAGPASAQMMRSGPGSDPLLSKLFGKITAFSANADISMGDSGGPEFEVAMSMLDGKSRTEVDIAKASGGRMPQAAIDRMKAMGMGNMVSISLPEKAKVLIIYPGMQAYAEQAYDQSQAAEAGDAKVESSSLGSETIDGHECDKTKLTITDKDGGKHEALAWYAKDLKGFPIQLQMSEGGATMQMKFKDIKFDKPDAKLFEAPTGYTKYASMQQMMQTEMMKRMGGVGGPAGAGGPPH